MHKRARVCVGVGVCAHLHQLREIVSQLIIAAALDPAHSHFSHFCVSKPEYNKHNINHMLSSLSVIKASHQTNKVFKNHRTNQKKDHMTKVKH